NCTGTLYRLGEPGQWLGSPGPAGRMGMTMPQLLRLLRCIGPADIEVPLPRGLLALLLQPGKVRAAVAAVAILGPLRVDGMLQLPVEGRQFPPFLLGRHDRGSLHKRGRPREHHRRSILDTTPVAKVHSPRRPSRPP